MVDESDAAYVDRTRDGDTDSENHKDNQFHRHRIDSVELGRALVDSDRLNVKTESRPFKKQVYQDDENHDDDNRCRYRDVGNESSEVSEQGTFNVRCRSSVNPVGDGSSRRVQNQGCDHRLYVELRDEHSVEETENNRDDTCDYKTQHDCAHVDCSRTQDFYEHRARYGSRRTDRDVLSFSRRGNQRHSDGKNHKLRCSVQDAYEVSGENRVPDVVLFDCDRKEARVANQIEDDENQKRNDWNCELRLK